MVQTKADIVVENSIFLLSSLWRNSQNQVSSNGSDEYSQQIRNKLFAALDFYDTAIARGWIRFETEKDANNEAVAAAQIRALRKRFNGTHYKVKEADAIDRFGETKDLHGAIFYTGGGAFFMGATLAFPPLLLAGAAVMLTTAGSYSLDRNNSLHVIMTAM